MNPEIKAKWITALRSGEYTQGQHVLTAVDDDGNRSHCCLGVLCELAVDAGVLEREQDTDRINGRDAVTYQAASGETGNVYLPRPVVEWAGLDGSNPYFKIDGDLSSVYLSNLNDAGQSFHYIADKIEQHL